MEKIPSCKQTINVLWLDGQIANTIVSCTEWKATQETAAA